MKFIQNIKETLQNARKEYPVIFWGTIIILAIAPFITLIRTLLIWGLVILLLMQAAKYSEKILKYM